MAERRAEIDVDEPLARRLLRAQFRELELRALELVAVGWDNTVWRVDGQWALRARVALADDLCGARLLERWPPRGRGGWRASSARYVEWMSASRKKSLQEVLRERRSATPLLSAHELRERELARQREELEREAAALVARREGKGTPVDSDGKLAPELYRAVFAASPPAYFATRHWSRRSRAQRTAVPACEVARCGQTEGLRAQLVDPRAVGAEQPGTDLLTLCESCARRAVKRERELGRLPTRAELRELDPGRPLYTPAEIAALRARLRESGR